METKQDNNLYLQIWRNPIFDEQLLKIMKPTVWHTFCGLAVFINDEGECYPSLKRLADILGIKDVGTVSRRIKNLSELSFNGLPIIKVKRNKIKKDGKILFDNNHYFLNQKIVTIFQQHDSTIIRQKEQLEQMDEMKQKLANRLSFPHNGKQTT